MSDSQSYIEYEIDERKVFSIIKKIKMSVDKPSIQFHYQIESIEKVPFKVSFINHEDSFYYLEEN